MKDFLTIFAMTFLCVGAFTFFFAGIVFYNLLLTMITVSLIIAVIANQFRIQSERISELEDKISELEDKKQ